jgi:hypothetical protein
MAQRPAPDCYIGTQPLFARRARASRAVYEALGIGVAAGLTCVDRCAISSHKIDQATALTAGAEKLSGSSFMRLDMETGFPRMRNDLVHLWKHGILSPLL